MRHHIQVRVPETCRHNKLRGLSLVNGGLSLTTPKIYMSQSGQITTYIGKIFEQIELEFNHDEFVQSNSNTTYNSIDRIDLRICSIRRIRELSNPGRLLTEMQLKFKVQPL